MTDSEDRGDRGDCGDRDEAVRLARCRLGLESGGERGRGTPGTRGHGGRTAGCGAVPVIGGRWGGWRVVETAQSPIVGRVVGVRLSLFDVAVAAIEESVHGGTRQFGTARYCPAGGPGGDPRSTVRLMSGRRWLSEVRPRTVGSDRCERRYPACPKCQRWGSGGRARWACASRRAACSHRMARYSARVASSSGRPASQPRRRRSAPS